LLTKGEALAGVDKVSDDISLDTDLPVLIDAIDCIDRYTELTQLVERYRIKIDPDRAGPPAKMLVPTRLKLLQLLMGASHRPHFTTAEAVLAN
jgi:hypothetical protein